MQIFDILNTNELKMWAYPTEYRFEFSLKNKVKKVNMDDVIPIQKWIQNF
jgi:hypothetical protein